MDASLTWTRKDWTVRELNKGSFCAPDPRGYDITTLKFSIERTKP